MDTNNENPILKLLNQAIYRPNRNVNGFIHEKFQRIRAAEVQPEDELHAVYNLVDSHIPNLRNKAYLCYETAESRAATSEEKNKLSDLRKCLTSISGDINDNCEDLMVELNELPKEWTIIQLTPQYNYLDDINYNNDKYFTTPLHISVFNCGQRENRPFVVTVEEPRSPLNGECINILQHLQEIIKQNKEKFNIRDVNKFLNKTSEIDSFLKELINDMENLWLGEWKCLFGGKLCNEEAETEINNRIKQFFAEKSLPKSTSTKNEQIINCVIKNMAHLTSQNLKKIFSYCLPDSKDKRMFNDLSSFCRKTYNEFGGIKRHPIILVINEKIDGLPWEMLEVLKDRTVTRLPSFHFVYLLYKSHQKDIKNGYKIVSNMDNGRFLVDPDDNLKEMQKRIMNFINYWLPNWSGLYGDRPPAQKFIEFLTESDIFSYHGHGGGGHIFNLNELLNVQINAVVFLFGCSSTRTRRHSTQSEMSSPFNIYLIARCPCLIGTLWEVSDLDTDILTTKFLSKWLPTKTKSYWNNIDRTVWKKSGDIIERPGSNEPATHEPDICLALRMAAEANKVFLNKAACVIRGLPVKFER